MRLIKFLVVLGLHDCCINDRDATSATKTYALLMHLSQRILAAPQVTLRIMYDTSPSDHTGDSDNSNYFLHHSDITNDRNIYLLGGIMTMKVHGRVEILTGQYFHHQNALGQPATTPPGFTLTGASWLCGEFYHSLCVHQITHDDKILLQLHGHTKSLSCDVWLDPVFEVKYPSFPTTWLLCKRSMKTRIFL